MSELLIPDCCMHRKKLDEVIKSRKIDEIQKYSFKVDTDLNLNVVSKTE